MTNNLGLGIAIGGVTALLLVGGVVAVGAATSMGGMMGAMGDMGGMMNRCDQMMNEYHPRPAANHTQPSNATNPASSPARIPPILFPVNPFLGANDPSRRG